MKIINYTIEFFSDWHCGSGLAAGADIDALVIKDKNDLPYIPGKTIKGLLREAVVDMLYLKDFIHRESEEESTDKIETQVSKEEIKDAFVKTFGYFTGSENVEKGSCFFTNAIIPTEISNIIIESKAQRYLYRKQTSTAIDECGIAKDNTLRRIETVIPCTLTGTIYDIHDHIYPYLVDGSKMIKRIGLNRNRGLGRCQITID